MFVVQCGLYSEDGKHSREQVYNPSSVIPTAAGHQRIMSFNEPLPIRNLMGGLVSNAYPLTDPDGEPGIFFIFQDLSVRTEGRFRLKFRLMDLSAGYLCY